MVSSANSVFTDESGGSTLPTTLSAPTSTATTEINEEPEDEKLAAVRACSSLYEKLCNGDQLLHPILILCRDLCQILLNIWVAGSAVGPDTYNTVERFVVADSVGSNTAEIEAMNGEDQWRDFCENLPRRLTKGAEIEAMNEDQWLDFCQTTYTREVTNSVGPNTAEIDAMNDENQSRDACQTLFTILLCENEVDDSLLRACFVLFKHLYNVRDRKASEKTLDFYVMFCHQLMIRVADLQLGGCWLDTEKLFSLRRQKQGSGPEALKLCSPEEEIREAGTMYRKHALGSAINKVVRF